MTPSARVSAPGSRTARVLRSLSDEADAEHEEPSRKDDAAEVGEVDQGIGCRGGGREDGEEEGARNEDRREGNEAPYQLLERSGEIGLVHVAENDEGQDKEDAGVGMSR